MYTVLIWGTGRDYNSHFNCIRLLELQGQISVVGVTSDDKSITASIDGYPFVRKSDIRSLDFDYCIVAVKDGGGGFLSSPPKPNGLEWQNQN